MSMIFSGDPAPGWDTEKCVYYCPDFPECEYVGMTSRSFKTRMSEHRDYPKRDVDTESSGQHFTKRGHNVTLTHEKSKRQAFMT